MVVTGTPHAPSGKLLPGARIGHTDPIAPSPGGDRYEAFCRKHIRQSKGRWRGKPLVFYPEQSAFHAELFRTDHNGRRIHREALYKVARKNGKSTDVAALALYLLTADGEPAPEVYAAAGARDQAKIMLEEAKRMVRQSPSLSEWCKVYRNEIVVPSIDGVFRAVSADAGLQFGSNPHGIVADEIAFWKGDAGRELWDALTTGTDAREDPLAVAITTAGYNKDGIAWDLVSRMLDDPDDPETLLYWIGALDDEDVESYETWKRANPAPWLNRKTWARQLRRNPLPVFMRLHLNRWTDAEHLWLKPQHWHDCAVPGTRIKVGERVWIGVDIGIRHDSTAVVEVAKRTGSDGKPRYVARAYIFRAAEQDGVLDLAPVENLIKELARTRRVMEVRYDPHFFHRSAEDLSEVVRMQEVPMSNARAVPMAQLTFDVIVEHLIEYDPGDAYAKEFTKQVLAAAVRETERGWRWSKAKSQEHIDALVALGLALSGTTEARGAEPGARPPRSAAAKRSGGERRAAAHEHDALTKRARAAVHQGRVVECTAEQYHATVRTALQNYAGELIDTGQDAYAIIALREVERLDSIHDSGF